MFVNTYGLASERRPRLHNRAKRVLTARKWLCMLLVLCLAAVWPPIGEAGTAQALGSEDETILLDGTPIGNATVAAGNAFRNFNVNGAGFASSPGFVKTDQNGSVSIYSDGTMTVPTNDSGSAEFEVRVKDNPLLKAIAESGDGEIVVGWDYLKYDSGLFWTAVTSASFTILNPGEEPNNVLSGHSGGGTIGYTEQSAYIKADSVIRINVWIEDKDAGAGGVFIKFRDTKRPELKSYTFTGNGVERKNLKDEWELYAKATDQAKEYVSLAFNFSELVRPRNVNSANSDAFLRQPLFVTPMGDNLPTQGQEQFLKNRTYTEANFSGHYLNVPLKKDIEYRYTVEKWHHSGLNPVRPRMTPADQLEGIDRGPLDESMLEKLQKADFIDAAGNRVKPIAFPVVGSNDSQLQVRDKTVDPFRAYKVIIDAVAPKYSKVANGIQPEITTGATVNEGDVLDFTVQFDEEVLPRDDRDGNAYNDRTYLLFNNGMRAYYHDEDNNSNLGYYTKNVRFRMIVPPGQTVETPLLKVLALTHDRKDGMYPLDSQYLLKDKQVLQDYAGNLLVEDANLLGDHTDGNTTHVNSKIDWAKLSVDNTPPTIRHFYETGGATDTAYAKRGKVTIDAHDAAVPIPQIDPEYDATNNFERPSRGIYRPSNMTGPSAPAGGLVYYAWTRSAQNPLLGKESDQYAAIKRFSLTAKQPQDLLYPNDEALAGLTLHVANNQTNLIAPPAEAITAEGSGTWHLHMWTADMTWDTAREVMQYAKLRSFPTEHSAVYGQWLAEAPGSNADKEAYANSKAMEAVGQYDQTAYWTASDFKQADSNWTYRSAPLLLDNQGPAIGFASIADDNTANVSVTVTVSDAHSGLQETYYQWVQKDGQPQDVLWKPAAVTDGQFAVGTRNEVPEDGQYALYVKAEDKLGNGSSQSSVAVTVNSASQVEGSFAPEGTPGRYVKSHDVTFKMVQKTPLTVSAVTYSVYAPPVTNSVYGMTLMTATLPFQAGYAFSFSSVRPETEAAYTWMTGVSDAPGEYVYTIPADASQNGTRYLHVMVKEPAANRSYFYQKAYYFDNQPPTVAFGLEQDLYPRTEQSVSYLATDPLNAVTVRHQWIKEGEAAPAADSPLWSTAADASSPNAATVRADGLEPGQSQDYKLYVLAEDAAGNAAIAAMSGHVRVAQPKIEVPADARSELMYVYGNESDGYTAIVQLILEIEDKTGYTYSISTDYGQSWLRWRPYTNFVSVPVAGPAVQAGQILVRYQTGRQPDGSEGIVGEAKPLAVDTVSTEEPVYGLAGLSTERPVSPLAGVEIDIRTPIGIKVVPSAVNPGRVEGSRSPFTVKQNGYYAFDLTDALHPERKATLYIVVGNIDSTPPTATIEKLLGEGSTAGNVTVRLRPSEPVRITNNNGSTLYTFRENGSFEFEFLDEAGNSGRAEAVVSNIDRQGPRVRIARSYGKDDGTEYARIGAGPAELAEGVRLTVEKESEHDKEFFLPEGMPSSVVMTANGTAEFIVYDELNNMTVVRDTISHIVDQPPEAERIEYTLVDEDDNPLPESAKVVIDGQTYAKGRMKVTISGQAAAPNRVFLGTSPYQPDSGVGYVNQISDEDGSFTASRTFSANGSLVIAISDLLGNVNRIPITIVGLDNKPPELTLRSPAVGVPLNKPDFDFAVDLGGFTVSDDVSSPENIRVTISGLDLTRLGRQTVTYTAVDQAGNSATAQQDVMVVSADGMLIFGNDTLISAASAETAIFDTNRVRFKVTGFNEMQVAGEKLTNESGTFDLHYVPGLFREGQLKTIATKLSYAELIAGQYEVAFPKTGWYTVIVRNQEREREYATFFISKTE